MARAHSREQASRRRLIAGALAVLAAAFPHAVEYVLSLIDDFAITLMGALLAFFLAADTLWSLLP